MQNNLYIPLNDRVLIALSGDDAPNFLQGLITNDINKLEKESIIYALMLTPQGKFLYDFFISKVNDKIILDCNSLRLEEIKKKLAMYKLRSKVIIEDISGEYEVVAINSEFEGALPDSRSLKMPYRSIIKKGAYSELEKSGLTQGALRDYEDLRISLCIPSDKDMGLDKSFPLEFEMDQHNAIDYKKGCYVGQEITARTHYRGTLRKKTYVVTAIEGTDLSAYQGEEITTGSIKIGILCSASGNKAIALLRMEDLEKPDLNAQVKDIKLSII